MSYEEQKARIERMTTPWGAGPTNEDNKVARMGVLHSLYLVLRTLRAELTVNSSESERIRKGFSEINTEGIRVALTTEQIEHQRDLVCNTIVTLLENPGMADFSERLSSSVDSLDTILRAILGLPEGDGDPDNE